MVIRSFDVGVLSIGAERVRAQAVAVAASKAVNRSRARRRGGRARAMHTLVGLMVVAAAACAIARPPVPTPAPVLPVLPHGLQNEPARRYLGEFIMPRLLMPSYFSFDDNYRADPVPDEHEWLNKEIDRLNQMEEEEEPLTPYDEEYARWMPPEPYNLQRALEGPIVSRDLPNYIPDSPGRDDAPPLPPPQEMPPDATLADARKKKQSFAMTPLDKGYYDPVEATVAHESDGPHEGGQSQTIELTPPRQTRQNPNHSKMKNLVAENLSQLRTGFTPDTSEGTDRPLHMPGAADPADSIYSVALIAAVGAALAMAIVGFGFGWYTLSKKAKAAADVDYPAYGVTGPTVDPSGDRKLAHSAHMYHYQHQKQQIIAMERNGLEQRNGSVSDPESEEENEEGDYTVYECPGFATTGEMEVKNPLFSEEPASATPPAAIPATPGKCELVKPQPKD